MVRYPIPGILFAREHREKKREKNRGGVCPALLFYVLLLLFILIAISCCPIAVRDCSEAPLTSGVHKISLNQGSELLPVYCDQTADGGGTVITSFVIISHSLVYSLSDVFIFMLSVIPVSLELAWPSFLCGTNRRH